MLKRKKKRKRKNRFILVFLLFILSLALFVFSVFIKSKNILDIEEFYTSLNVSGVTGIDLNKTALTFGNIIPGSFSARNLIVENNYNFSVKVEIRTKGNIAKFLNFESPIFIGKNETKRIGITAIIPENEKYGKYEGKVIALIKLI